MQVVWLMGEVGAGLPLLSPGMGLTWRQVQLRQVAHFPQEAWPVWGIRAKGARIPGSWWEIGLFPPSPPLPPVLSLTYDLREPQSAETMSILILPAFVSLSCQRGTTVRSEPLPQRQAG